MPADLFTHAAPKPRRYTVDPKGPVIQGDPDITLILPHPRLAWPLARIELHQHDDGRWMWSASICGGGYKVGPKWGRFADTRDDARRLAAAELLERIDKRRPESLAITPKMHRDIREFAVERMI